MTKLKIADTLSLPLDAATQTFAFIARKGAGKTYAAGKLVELLMDAGVQVVVLDTVGNWYGLRLGADGKSAGFDVPVLGGLRGDIPLEAAGGALIADIVVETGRSLVIDMSQFSLADRKRFAAAFGERLWRAKKAERHPSPVHLVIEESQLIVPQDVRGDTAAMVGIYEEIIRLGRNYGIGVSMITQRPQSVNKEVLNQTECLFVGQVNGAQERDALKKWISHQGMDVHLVDVLPSLKIGTFYVWSPQWLNLLEKIQVLPKRTYDASATPKVGDKRVQRDLKPLDLSELQERLKATIEKAKAEDPRELRKQIAELKKELQTSNSKLPKPEVESKIVEKPVLKDVQLDRIEGWLGHLSGMEHRLAEQAAKVEERRQIVLDSVNAITRAIASARAPQQTLTRETQTPRVTPPRSPGRPAVTTKHEGSLPPGEAATLTAALQFEGLDRKRLGILTSYKRSSRDAYIARLQAKGLIEVRGPQLFPTADGRAALNGSYEPLPTGQALIDYWRARLPEGERKTLDVLIDHGHGGEVAREVIDELTGYKRSSRDAYLVRLKARGLVEFAGRGLVRASAELFD